MKTILSVIGGITLLAATIFGIYMGYMAIWNAGYDSSQRDTQVELQAVQAVAATLEGEQRGEHAALVQAVLILSDISNLADKNDDYARCLSSQEWLKKRIIFDDSSVRLYGHGTYSYERSGSGKIVDLVLRTE